METLKAINLGNAGYINCSGLISAMEKSDVKEEITNTVKEVIKQIIGDSVVSINEAVEVVEKTLGYRLVGKRAADTYYFLKNE